MARYLLLVIPAVLVGLVLFGVLRQVFGSGFTTLLSLALLVVGGVIVFRNLQTNRKVADAQPEARAAALTFTPEPGKAALYILRTQFVGKAVGVNLQIDGRDVAQLKSPRFTRILLTPGAHHVAGYTGTTKKPADGYGANINANAGEIIVLMCAVEPQLVGSVVKFTPLTLDKARADLSKTRMVQPDLAEI
ncbi:hypothetical protein U91I_04046 [alpha proteobacterium U9-1i]|nr:hypothetical protein U91I_04046 [alpha proteobacterium U9-1i]